MTTQIILNIDIPFDNLIGLEQSALTKYVYDVIKNRQAEFQVSVSSKIPHSESHLPVPLDIKEVYTQMAFAMLSNMLATAKAELVKQLLATKPDTHQQTIYRWLCSGLCLEILNLSDGLFHTSWEIASTIAHNCDVEKLVKMITNWS